MRSIKNSAQISDLVHLIVLFANLIKLLHFKNFTSKNTPPVLCIYLCTHTHIYTCIHINIHTIYTYMYIYLYHIRSSRLALSDATLDGKVWPFLDLAFVGDYTGVFYGFKIVQKYPKTTIYSRKI